MRVPARVGLALGILGACADPVAPPRADETLTITALTDTVLSAIVGSGVSGPRVRVTDASGNPVRGVNVRFLGTRGRPDFSVGGASTDANGVAWLSRWASGTRAGVQEISVALAQNTSDTRATFRLTVYPGAPVSVGPSHDSVVVAVGYSSAPVTISRLDTYGNVVDDLPGTTVTSDHPEIVSVAEGGALTGVAPGRTVVMLENGVHRYGVLAISGDAPTRLPIVIAANPNAGYALATAPSGLSYAVDFNEYSAGALHRIEATAQVASTIAWMPSTPRIIDGVFAPDEARAYFISQFAALTVVDASTDAIVDAVDLPHEAQRIAVTADGAYLIVTGPDEFTRIATADLTMTTFALPWQDLWDATNGIALHPSANTVYLSSTAGFVASVDYLTGAVLQSIALDGRPQGLALDAARGRLIVVREAAGLRTLDAGTLGHLFDSMPLSGYFDVRLDPDSDDVWVSRPNSNSLDRFTASLARPVERLSMAEPRRVRMRPDGTVLVSAYGGVRMVPAAAAVTP